MELHLQVTILLIALVVEELERLVMLQKVRFPQVKVGQEKGSAGTDPEINQGGGWLRFYTGPFIAICTMNTIVAHLKWRIDGVLVLIVLACMHSVWTTFSMLLLGI